ncbi:protoporphyrinogen/coproporphyrinogen oxidase [Microbacterium sp. NPDC055910]|uniref:protoporphyrinogen/coproporphyrinogen oxidase n=1 Tax=Microbacterium sp. NPDC055910 TaxID=3345659 RepID=UPI0035DCE97A
MNDAAPLENLAAHARDTHVVVIGGGIAGLVAAYECAKVGLAVTVLEAREAPGGAVRSGAVGETELDLGADGYAPTGGHVRALVDELGLADRVRSEAPTTAWVAGLPAGAAPLPPDNVLGIPANAWDPAVRRIIGWRGAWRAYLDRLRPPLTIGQQRNLGTLVRGRMGPRVVERLVAPLSVGRHGLAPADVDVELAAPGLNTALTRTGSLSGAVAQLRGAAPAGPGYETIDGGMRVLVDALAQRLVELGADVRTAAEVVRIDRVSGGGWDVVCAGEEETRIAADAVVVATPEHTARLLLARHVEGVDEAEARTTDVVTLVLDGVPDSARAAVYPLPGSHAASSVVDVTARWPSLAGAVGPDARVVRVTLAAPPAGDDDAVAAAVHAASALLDLTEPRVRAARRERFDTAPPRSARGRMDQTQRVRTVVHAVDGLAVVGAWVSGSGLAQVVPDVVAEAERVRRRALFGNEPLQ